jgi:DNA-binding response OmpR family regulator
MKRRILLVDDEVAVLLTMKAVLEISGFDVDTAASAREGKSRLKTRTYDMVITDMRMESEEAGREVIVAARTAPYHPAVALLTAFPVADDDWQNMGADKMLVKPMQTRMLIQQIEKLLDTHQAKLKKLESAGVAAGLAAGFAAGIAAGSVTKPKPAAKTSAKAVGAKRATVVKKAAGRKTPAKKTTAKKTAKKAAANK